MIILGPRSSTVLRVWCLRTTFCCFSLTCTWACWFPSWPRLVTQAAAFGERFSRGRGSAEEQGWLTLLPRGGASSPHPAGCAFCQGIDPMPRGTKWTYSLSPEHAQTPKLQSRDPRHPEGAAVIQSRGNGGPARISWPLMGCETLPQLSLEPLHPKMESLGISGYPPSFLP